MVCRDWCWGLGWPGFRERGPRRQPPRAEPAKRPRRTPRGHGLPKRAGRQRHGASVSGEANGTLALITGTGGPAQWLYLIDTKERAFALYVIDPANPKGIVKLEASRQYKWDLKLEHYNNQAPEPDAIKATVETLARSAQ